MRIELNLIIKEEEKYIIFINHMKAISNNIVKKEKSEKDFIVNSIDGKLLEIKNSFLNGNHEYIVSTNNYKYINTIKNILEIDTVSLVSDELYISDINSIKLEVEQEQMVKNLPSYIYQIETDVFKKNVLLFLITRYFDQNQDKIEEFPLFLEMKKNKEIDEYMLVEEFVESILEKTRELGF